MMIIDSWRNKRLIHLRENTSLVIIGCRSSLHLVHQELIVAPMATKLVHLRPSITLLEVLHVRTHTSAVCTGFLLLLELYYHARCIRIIEL